MGYHLEQGIDESPKSEEYFAKRFTALLVTTPPRTADSLPEPNYDFLFKIAGGLSLSHSHTVGKPCCMCPSTWPVSKTRFHTGVTVLS